MCYEDFSGENQIIFKRSGDGIVSIGVREQNVKWSLEVDIVGSKKFEIIFQGLPINDNNIMFKGIDDNNEFEIDSTELYIKRRNSELMSLHHHYYCIFSEFFLKKISDGVELELSKAEAYLLNFDFQGLEYNTVGDRIVANQFSINSKEWIFECVLLDKYEQLKNQINAEILKEVIFSKVILKPLVPTSYIGFDQELNSIVLFFSSITLNGVYPQLVKYFNSEEIVGIKIIDTVKKPYNSNASINNLHTYQGLKLCAEKSYNTFKELENPLELMGFVNTITIISR